MSLLFGEVLLRICWEHSPQMNADEDWRERTRKARIGEIGRLALAFAGEVSSSGASAA